MKTVTVRASQTYEVKVGRGLLKDLGREVAPRMKQGRAVCLVTDTNVAPLYLDAAQESLEKSGLRVEPFVMFAGEIYKNPGNYMKLLNYMAENQITRGDALVALGGGVVGDLTGFAAATYLRGVDFFQVPTTLLAAVDASVGGKTAINLDMGKNLAGAFYQPRLVLCDLDTLGTLPDEVFAEGCAEVIKYGMIGDPDLLAKLETIDFRSDPEDIVARCVEMKRDLVEADEYDTGARQLLNLGHTVGHGIEACSDYEIPHGHAVSMGMVIAARTSIAHGLCPAEVLPRLIALLERYGLPTETEYNARTLYDKVLADKKRAGETQTLVTPVAWGKSELYKVPVAQLREWIEKGLK